MEILLRSNYSCFAAGSPYYYKGKTPYWKEQHSFLWFPTCQGPLSAEGGHLVRLVRQLATQSIAHFLLLANAGENSMKYTTYAWGLPGATHHHRSSTMKQIPLGKTGRDVSALCLGCMFFGTLTTEETAYQLADRYFEAGGRFF